MSDIQHLVLSIVHFLGDQLQSGDLTADAKESLEVAIQCLETAYGVSHDDPEVATNSTSRSLLDIFKEATKSEQQHAHVEVSAQAKVEAENLKNEGNQLMKAEKHREALECYSKAIQFDCRNAVYFCNRAAAHSKLNDHRAAVEDCKRAIEIDPAYSKAYGRMGLAYASLNEHQKARECYQKAVELDPGNDSYINNLRVAEEKLRDLQHNAGVNFGPGRDRVGGSGTNFNPPLEFSSLLSNPALVSMATQLMQDPNMQNMMASMMSGTLSQGGSGSTGEGSGGGGGGGGGSGMEALLQAGQQLAAQMQASNPDLVEQLRRQMNNTTGSRQNSNDQDPAHP